MEANTKLSLKVAQDEFCYTMAEIEKWFEQGEAGFIPLWDLLHVANHLQMTIEALETEVLVETILSEFKGPCEVRELVDAIIYGEFPRPENTNDLLDIDVEYDFTDEGEQVDPPKVMMWP